MRRKFLLVALMVAMVFSIVACTDNGVDNTENQGAVAIVNDEEISREEFDYMLERMIGMYAESGIDFDGEEGQEMLQHLEQDVLNNLINEKVLLQEVDRKGYEVTDEEIEMEVEQIKLQFNSEEEFNQELEAIQLTLEELNESIAMEIKFNQYVENEVGEVIVEEEEVRELYEEYKAMIGEEMPSFEEIQQHLEVELQNEKINQQMMHLMQQLVEASDVEILI